MLFTGHSEHTVDAKQRLAVPAKYRNQWDAVRDGGAMYCVTWPTPSPHLRLYTEARFLSLSEGRPGDTLTPGEDVAGLESDYFGLAERIEFDSAGRLNLPKTHLELTGLGRDVMLVGARDRLEVHDRETWQSTLAERFRNLPNLVRRLSGGGSDGSGGTGVR